MWKKVLRSGLLPPLKVPIGHPVANTATYVLDEDMKPVKGGEVGELYIASHNLALGYAGDQGINNQSSIKWVA